MGESAETERREGAPNSGADLVLRVGILELPAAFGHPAAMLQVVKTCLGAGAGRWDTLVLPETALTGYLAVTATGIDESRTPAAFAEGPDGEYLRALCELARGARTSLLAPHIERAPEGVYNTLIAIDADGALVHRYRKRHPWYPETWATPGPEPFGVVSWLGVPSSLAICFDAHFLEDEAAAALAQAKVLYFPSAWVDDGDTDLRDELLGGLARRHDLWVVNANWGPGEIRVRGQGGSRVLRPSGQRVEEQVFALPTPFGPAPVYSASVELSPARRGER